MNPDQYVVNRVPETNDDNFAGLHEFEDIILSSQSLFSSQNSAENGANSQMRFNFGESNTQASVSSQERLVNPLPDRASDLDSEITSYRNMTQEVFKNCK